MTRQQALAMYLLSGKTVSLKNAYSYFGISCLSREVIRLIEKPFNIQLTRKWMKGRTKYGTPCKWIEYSLSNTKLNAAGIKALKQLVSKREIPLKKSLKMKGKV